MSNKLYLLHRPTHQYVQLAERRSYGWRPVAAYNLQLDNMLQRAANRLSGQIFGHQDDFALLLEDASGSPWARPWLPPKEGPLDPAQEDHRLTLFALREGLRQGPAPEDGMAQRERRAVEMLRAENMELRAGIAHLAELLELRALGEEIFHHEILGGVHPRRIEFLERKGITWVKAIAWRDQFAEKLRGWLAGK